MDQSEKARFILSLHKHSLQAFDGGGTVLGGPSGGGVQPNAGNPNNGLIGGLNGFLGLNNNFQPSAANIQQGTNATQLNNAYQGVQGGIQGQQAFANQAAAQNGFGNQSNVFAQQQALSNQLQQQANGQGPNVALNQLNQATGQNVQNQAALMASQRGAGANPALIARQAAMQGASTQQNAAGQAATLQAQQQIAAQAALANQQAQMQGVAANQIGTQGQGVTNVSQSQQNAQGILQGANASANNAAVSQQNNINSVNAQTAAANQAAAGKTMGGIFSGLSAIAGVPMAQGGLIEMSDHLHEAAKLYHPHLYAGGGEIDLSGSEGLSSGGGNVEASSSKERAVKKDNSYENDKVPALLSEGEIVLPRSVTMHPEAPQKAAEFVMAVLNKRKMGKK